MTARVHVASPSTPFKMLVRLIEENRISAVPIVDAQGSPIGIVSEADLLLKENADPTSPLDLLRQRRQREKADGVLAADVMTSPVVTVGVDTPIAQAARVMRERNVRRLVVVDTRIRIAGVVSRSDLLKVFLRTDEDLRDEVLHKLLPAVVPIEASGIDVEVESNVITLSGRVDRRTDVEILYRLARDLDGVVNVVNHLSFRWDDMKRHAGAL
jgi:CBS domain-containing protein